MKSLVEYIREAKDATQTSMDVTFDFTGIENGEDTVKSLTELGTKHGIGVSADNLKVTISLSKDTIDKAEPIIDVLQQTVEMDGKSTKRAADESYAQKLAALEASMQKVHDFMDECDEADDDATKKDDDDKNKE